MSHLVSVESNQQRYQQRFVRFQTAQCEVFRSNLRESQEKPLTIASV